MIFPHDGNWKKSQPEDVAEMKALAAEGWRKRAIARRYGIRDQTVAYHLKKELPHYVSRYARALASAAEARKKGKIRDTAQLLRVAAKALLSA